MTHAGEIGAVIAAGGSGERAGAGEPKQFRPVRGIPILLRALRPFTSHPSVHDVVVVLPSGYAENPPSWLRDLAGDRLRIVAGGDTRASSVQNGVAALSTTCTGVLIHDAARPFVSRNTVDEIVERVARGSSAIAAVTVSDTIKRSQPGGEHVLETVPREGLWKAQTPQGFPREILERAYALAGGSAHAATDESLLVESAGFPVEIVRDTASNIKVTTAEDFVIAEALADV